jgi:pyruvate,water dikinase
VVDKARRSIVVRSVRPKELTIEPAANGGTVTRPLTAEESHRAVLSDEEVLKLTDLGVAIEAAYGSPQDTEWAFDDTAAVWMLQSRPITTLGPAETAEPADVLLRGLGAAPGQASGLARLLTSLKDAAKLDPGDILVTHMTAPDWVPLMRKAAAVVTDSGGMTCHAAIVSRELGIPCVVGTGDATQTLRDGEPITVNATDGTVLSGISAAPASPATVGAAAAPASLATVAVTGTRLLVNLSEPSQAQAAAMLDVDGVGLLRAELMIVEALDGVHPRTLLAEGRGNQFVERMAAGLNTFASAFAPRPITYRTTDSHAGRDRGSRRRGGRRRPSRGADQAR